MNLTKKQGIFKIQYDTTREEYEWKLNVNKMAFWADIGIEINEKLKESNKYKRAIKFHAKALMKELESSVETHYNEYANHGDIDNDGKKMNALNVYSITANHYDYLFDFITNRSPSEIVSAVELIKRFEANGGKLEDINIEFKPIKL